MASVTEPTGNGPRMADSPAWSHPCHWVVVTRMTAMWMELSSQQRVALVAMRPLWGPQDSLTGCQESFLKEPALCHGLNLLFLNKFYLFSIVLKLPAQSLHL